MNKKRIYNKTRTEKHRFYYTATWRKLRTYHLQIEPLCQMCLAVDKIVPAEIVDHIIPFKDRYDPLATDADNFKSLCWSCHSIATQRETKKPYETFPTYEAWLKYKFEPQRVLGLDGYYL